MIHHLSAPPKQSVNGFISKDEFTLRYTLVDNAIAILTHLGLGASMAKVDLRSAFRTVPVCRDDRELLGICWQGSYYIDTCLPFGLHSTPYLFNQFAEALQWIMQTNYGLSHLIHYLDDFLLMDLSELTCSHHLRRFLTVCTTLGIPVAEDNLEGPTTTLTFLGLEIDSVRQEIRLPEAKLIAIHTELRKWSQRKSTTKRQLLSLIGLLRFAAKAVPAGRLFLRRLITLSTKVQRLHHNLRLNKDARADIHWWMAFLHDWNGRAFFISPSITTANEFQLYTDASGRLGCGAYFDGHWFHHAWQPHQQLSKSISI